MPGNNGARTPTNAHQQQPTPPWPRDADQQQQQQQPNKYDGYRPIIQRIRLAAGPAGSGSYQADGNNNRQGRL